MVLAQSLPTARAPALARVAPRARSTPALRLASRPRPARPRTNTVVVRLEPAIGRGRAVRAVRVVGDASSPAPRARIAARDPRDRLPAAPLRRSGAGGAPLDPASSSESEPWWRSLARKAGAISLALVLLAAPLSAPPPALAANSSGRMGGSNFRSSEPAPEPAPAPAYSYAYTADPGYDDDYPFPARNPATASPSPSRSAASDAAAITYAASSSYSSSSYESAGDITTGELWLIALVLGTLLVLAFLDEIKQALSGGGLSLGGDQIAVVKVQIGLLGMARQLQLDLEDIAEKADTSSMEGLHYVLEETTLALLRNPEYCVYGCATSEVAKGPEMAEDLFNELSMDERGKFEEETLVNVNAKKKLVAAKKGPAGDGMNNEYILVTIIAACDGGLKLPPVQDATELRTALKRVGAIRADALQAVEVLWTPQEEGDTLTEDELLIDYPSLNVL